MSDQVKPITISTVLLSHLDVSLLVFHAALDLANGRITQVTFSCVSLMIFVRQQFSLDINCNSVTFLGMVCLKASATTFDVK